jgi:hypothetical protein
MKNPLAQSIQSASTDMDITPQPIPAELYSKMIEAGIEKLELKFEGGSDEGWCYTSCYNAEHMPLTDEQRKVQLEAEEWAEETYHYSGAGDGTPYGDDVTYDLKNMTYEHEEWYMARATAQHDMDKPFTIA